MEIESEDLGLIDETAAFLFLTASNPNVPQHVRKQCEERGERLQAIVLKALGE